MARGFSRWAGGPAVMRLLAALVCFVVATDSSPLTRAAQAPASVFAVVDSDAVGLIDAASGTFESGSLFNASWAGDVLTATKMSPNETIAYCTPDDGEDTFLVSIDTKTKRATKAIVGGDQGELICLSKPDGSLCYGVSPVSGKTPTQLIEVKAKDGDSKPVVTLKRYVGYSVGSSIIDPEKQLYHAILVGDPHKVQNGPANTRVGKQVCGGDDCGSRATGDRSNQYLVTIDLVQLQVTHEVPVGRNFMGPFVVTENYGLASFGADDKNRLMSVNYMTGAVEPLLPNDFGTVVPFGAAFSRNNVYVNSVFPHPPRLISIDMSSKSEVKISANVKFTPDVHTLSAEW